MAEAKSALLAGCFFPSLAMPGPGLGALLAAPLLLGLTLVLSSPWHPWDPPPPPPPPPQPRSLTQELEQRQRDLSTLASSSLEEEGQEEDRLGCAELSGARVLGLAGAGITKVVLKVALGGGAGSGEVALKAVHWAGGDVQSCIRRYGHFGGCYRLAAAKLMKETALLRRLDHPGIVKLLGQCSDSSLSGPEMKVVTMLELGKPLEMIQLLQTPWEERFKICLDLIELLYYMANSPLGSIALLDFQPRQFVLVNGSLKVTDLDDVTTTELPCWADEDCMLEFPTKNFSLQCTVQGKCEGINEKRNLFNAYRYFFTYLLPHTAPVALQPILKDILNATGDLRYGVNETLRAFQKVFHLYKSGLYLQRKTSNLREYIALKGFHSSGTEDYKCWPSNSHLGCMLSVHNAEEAATICNSHPQCQHFTITRQRTWTGRPLALFQSNLSDLIPGGPMVVYVKRSTASKRSFSQEA